MLWFNVIQHYTVHCMEWTSSRSKLPSKRCLFSIQPPSLDCSFPLDLGAPLKRDLEGAGSIYILID